MYDYLVQINDPRDKTKVVRTPRFDFARFVAFREGVFDPLNSYLWEEIKNLPKVGEYTVRDDINRPDMICAAIFGDDTQYWWLLVVYNNLLETIGPSAFIRVPNGTVINFFKIKDLEHLYFSLRTQEIQKIKT